jgi:hypothetical protein
LVGSVCSERDRVTLDEEFKRRECPYTWVFLLGSSALGVLVGLGMDGDNPLFVKEGSRHEGKEVRES